MNYHQSVSCTTLLCLFVTDTRQARNHKYTTKIHIFNTQIQKIHKYHHLKMENKIMKKSSPTTALALFIRLYSKRRNFKKNVRMDAIQTWTTLSKAEREYFTKKLSECRHNHKMKQANFLKATEPFMKKKCMITLTNSVIKEGKSDNKEQNFKDTEDVNIPVREENIVDYREISIDDIRDSNKENVSQHTMDKEQGIYSGNQDQPNVSSHSSEQDNNLNDEVYYEPSLTEPAAPSIRTGRQLYDLIQSSNRGIDDSWLTLPNTQKRRYQMAVSSLKNDYIQRFKTYLESLPPQELFNYYNNFF